jgi:hypothetical protein
MGQRKRGALAQRAGPGPDVLRRRHRLALVGYPPLLDHQTLPRSVPRLHRPVTRTPQGRTLAASPHQWHASWTSLLAQEKVSPNGQHISYREAEARTCSWPAAMILRTRLTGTFRSRSSAHPCFIGRAPVRGGQRALCRPRGALRKERAGTLNGGPALGAAVVY